MQEENYMDLVKEHIELDKLLVTTSAKYHNEIKILLKQKKEIMNKNGILANFQLKKIHKRLDKIKKLSQKEK